MEFLIRWSCRCRATRPREDCRMCYGKGYVEAWMPPFLLSTFKGWVIYGYRSDPPQHPQ